MNASETRSGNCTFNTAGKILTIDEHCCTFWPPSSDDWQPHMCNGCGDGQMADKQFNFHRINGTRNCCAQKMNYLKNGGYYLLTRPINLGGKYEDRLPSDNTRPVAGDSMDVKLINQFL